MVSRLKGHRPISRLGKVLCWLLQPLAIYLSGSACSTNARLGPFGKNAQGDHREDDSKNPSGSERMETSGDTQESMDGEESPPRDEEDTPATPPAPIAGAFLTSWCEKVDSESIPSENSSNSKDLVGCVVLDAQNEAYKGKVELTALEIFANNQKDAIKGEPVKTPDEGPWQQIFEVKDLRNQSIDRFRVLGKVDGHPLDILRTTSSRGLREPANQCEKVDLKTKMYSSIMDLRSSSNILNLGRPTVELFTGTLFEPQDTIFLESALGRNVVHGLEFNNSLNSNCPKNWYVTITDATNKILAEYHLLEQRTFTLSQGSFRMWLGYRDTHGGLYPTNEGGALYPGKSTQSTDGCRLKFVHESHACSKK